MHPDPSRHIGQTSCSRQVMYCWAALFFFLLILMGCHPQEDEQTEEKLFTLVQPSETGIGFRNDLTEDTVANILNYLYFFNGGGVAAGDLTGNGLPDLVFTANQGPDRLYINHGDWKFEEVSEQAGFDMLPAWSTGVTMADVNADGLLDIYICQVDGYMGMVGRNRLYLNQGINAAGVPTFEESAEAYGIGFRGFSTHAAFFDYDRDGDLDLYLLNHSVHTVRSYGDSTVRHTSDKAAGDVLFRNDGVNFTDVTKASGIYNSPAGYGLGLAIADFNNDGWPDIYVANDFHENDYLYYNRHDGTFAEGIRQSMGYTSRFSMGVDAADVNNNGLPDLISLDMKPEFEEIRKASVGEDPYEVFSLKERFGFHRQFARNHLQINQGSPQAGGPALFAETAQLAGIDATDWSWSALWFDMDQDGHKDLFISNGIYRRPNDLDYLTYISEDGLKRSLNAGVDAKNMRVILEMPSIAIPNYAFRNLGGDGGQLPSFGDHATAWGLDLPGFSNGAAYADLDGDGDLDLVVNNINAPATLYRNQTRERRADIHYLKLRLSASGQNHFGIGTKVEIFHGGKRQMQELHNARGFQSSGPPEMVFGLGTATHIDSALVRWPNGRLSQLPAHKADTLLVLHQNDLPSVASAGTGPVKPTVFTDISPRMAAKAHRENNFIDFNSQRIAPFMLSRQGPGATVADVDGDGLPDLYLCGASGQAGQLLLGRDAVGGTEWIPAAHQPWAVWAEGEETVAHFVDVNANGRPDLIIGYGGNEHPEGHPLLRDRLYLNQGHGRFVEAENAFPPAVSGHTSAIAASDFDQDSLPDLFVAHRGLAQNYGAGAPAFFLRNKGDGTFAISDQPDVPGLDSLGMVTGATWADLDGNGQAELIVVGEWMRPLFFKNDGGQFSPWQPQMEGLPGGKWPHGLWQGVWPMANAETGQTDYIFGNFGLNTPFTASQAEPLRLYLHDFDRNGAIDPVLVQYRPSLKGGTKAFTWGSRDELIAQMPFLKKRFVKYRDFAESTFEDVFTAQELAQATVKEVGYLASGVMRGRGNGQFVWEELPLAAQVAPIRATASLCDLANQPYMRLLAGAELYAQPSIGSISGGNGIFAILDGSNGVVSLEGSGLWAQNPVNQLLVFKAKEQTYLLVSINDAPWQLFRLNEDVPKEG